MKISLPVKLLNLYYLFQNFIAVTNYLLIFGFIFFTYFAFSLGSPTENDFVHYILLDISLFSAIIFYFVITIISIKATKNFMQNIPLTKIQKFSAILFPVVAILLAGCFIITLTLIK